jgi:hypothetical protein
MKKKTKKPPPNPMTCHKTWLALAVLALLAATTLAYSDPKETKPAQGSTIWVAGWGGEAVVGHTFGLFFSCFFQTCPATASCALA